MGKKHFALASALALLFSSGALHAQDFKLTSSGYFKNQGGDVMAFDDIYPEGHQGGGCIGKRFFALSIFGTGGTTTVEQEL